MFNVVQQSKTLKKTIIFKFSFTYSVWNTEPKHFFLVIEILQKLQRQICRFNKWPLNQTLKLNAFFLVIIFFN